jgi:heptosyltransferase-3
MPAQQPITIQPKRILVITLRYLGDTLLTTPLISALKQAYPTAAIDVLLPAANTGMLEGNADINALIPLPNRPSFTRFIKLLLGLYKHYDLAISTQAGDRPTLCAVIAGRISIGFVPEESGKAWWKKQLLTHWLVFKRDHDHAVLENLRFCALLGITPCFHLTAPQSNALPSVFMPKPYVVVHALPQWQYKQWHTEGWLAVIDYFIQQDFAVALTGSSNPDEQHTIKQLVNQSASPTVNVAGILSLGQLTTFIRQATLFIGPDTGITHLAAATGIPTAALFGPTDPKKWAPWPVNFAKNQAPFLKSGIQKQDNVLLIQNQTEKNCVPCQQEGCLRHRQSHSDCLEQLSAKTVIDAIQLHFSF